MMINELATSKISSGDLVQLKQGIYTNARTGSNRVHLADKTPGLVISKNGSQILVVIDGGKTLITNERACEVPK
tara:strand:- start:285 stop:506 length:222 start_codon:yes stop_codon:yes gene_type:complete